MTLTLYGGPRTRASDAGLDAALVPGGKGIPYELVELDLRGNQQRQPDYLAINPFGKLPALVDDSLQGPDGKPLTLFESGASFSVSRNITTVKSRGLPRDHRSINGCSSPTQSWRSPCLFPAIVKVSSAG